MFKSYTRYKKVCNGNIHELDLPNKIAIYSIGKNWYSTKLNKLGDIIIDTPTFTNLQWVQEIEDYPDGEIGALIFLGTIRSERRSINLYGDYMNQSFNLNELVKSEILKTMKEKYNTIDTFYNKDSTEVSLIGKFYEGIMKLQK